MLPGSSTLSTKSVPLLRSMLQTKAERKQDTIHNSPALNVALLADVQLHKFPKATGVVVVHRLRVAKGFHDGAVGEQGAAERITRGWISRQPRAHSHKCHRRRMTAGHA